MYLKRVYMLSNFRWWLWGTLQFYTNVFNEILFELQCLLSMFLLISRSIPWAINKKNIQSTSGFHSTAAIEQQWILWMIPHLIFYEQRTHVTKHQQLKTFISSAFNNVSAMNQFLLALFPLTRFPGRSSGVHCLDRSKNPLPPAR